MLLLLILIISIFLYPISLKNLVVSLKCFNPITDLDLIIMTDSGIIIKLPLDQVSNLKRATQGVRLMNLKDEQKVSTVALVDKEDNTDNNLEELNQSTEQTNE